MNTKYPLSVADCTNGKYTIVTKQGNHFAATYDPDACRLIAAAPELLGALQDLHRECVAAAKRAGTVWPLYGSAKALDEKCRAAIAKAEGK